MRLVICFQDAAVLRFRLLPMRCLFTVLIFVGLRGAAGTVLVAVLLVGGSVGVGVWGGSSTSMIIGIGVFFLVVC